MRRFLQSLLAILFLGICLQANGQQSRHGVWLGLSSNTLDVPDIDITTPNDSLRLTATSLPSFYSFGAYTRTEVKKIFLKTGFLLGRARLNYNVIDQANNRQVVESREDAIWYLDFPIELGYRFDFLTLHAGVNGSSIIDPARESILDVKSYMKAIGRFDWSMRAGLGVDLGEIMTVSANANYFFGSPSDDVTIYDRYLQTFNYQKLRIMVTLELPLNRYDK